MAEVDMTPRQPEQLGLPEKEDTEMTMEADTVNVRASPDGAQPEEAANGNNDAKEDMRTSPEGDKKQHDEPVKLEAEYAALMDAPATGLTSPAAVAEREARGDWQPLQGDGKADDDEDEKRDARGDAPPTPTFDSDEDDTARGPAQETLESAREEEAAEQPPVPTPVVMVAPGVKTRQLTNTPLGGAPPPLKPLTAALPPVARGQVRGQQVSQHISDAVTFRSQPHPKMLARSRRPPKYVRLATVTVSPARTRPLQQGPSLYYEEPRRPRKVISWDEAHNARPPLRVDMEGPTPCTYTPRVKPLYETNAPSFTFGSKCIPEKQGGSRTAWSKSWFQSSHVWNNKVDYARDGIWPSPNHYPKGPAIGPRQRTMPEAPSFTFGHKMAYSMIKPGAQKEPSPNEYKRQNADSVVLARGPAFTHQLRREGTTLWGVQETTPGPAAYRPNKQGPERPAFSIQGVRREKSHFLGPYCSL